MKNEIFIFIALAVVLISSFIKTEARSPVRIRCSKDSDCLPELACRKRICTNPCGPAWGEQICTVENHIAEYSCKPGFRIPEGFDALCIPSSWVCLPDLKDPNHSVKCEPPKE